MFWPVTVIHMALHWRYKAWHWKTLFFFSLRLFNLRWQVMCVGWLLFSIHDSQSLYENWKCNGIPKFDFPKFQSESEEGLHLQTTPANEFGVLVWIWWHLVVCNQIRYSPIIDPVGLQTIFIIYVFLNNNFLALCSFSKMPFISWNYNIISSFTLLPFLL